MDERKSNAKICLKNEGIVETNAKKRNYSLTDVNGETTFLAGKVNGRVIRIRY